MKPLIYLGLLVFSLVIVSLNFNIISTAFTIHSSPTYISAGSNGHSIVLEVSYTNQQFEELILTLKDKSALILIDESWFTRSTKQLKLLKEHDFEIGLLLPPDTSSKQISVFKERADEYFDTNVIWAGCSQSVCNEQILNYLHSQKINTLAITSYIEEDTSDFLELPNGSFIGIKLESQETISDEVMQLLRDSTFTSLEDNLFKLSIQTKRSP